MSQPIDTSRPLATHFEPKTLTELGINASQLLFKVSHQHTELPKTGIDYLLGKLPLGSTDPVAMDIDIGCGVYDVHGALMACVWYGQLRTPDGAVRHYGDSFKQVSPFHRPTIIKERVAVRLGELNDEVHKLVFFVNSHHRQPLAKATHGIIKLSDNEGHSLHELPLTTLSDGCTALAAWQMLRVTDDWCISALMQPVTGDDVRTLAQAWSVAS